MFELIILFISSLIDKQHKYKERTYPVEQYISAYHYHCFMLNCESLFCGLKGWLVRFLYASDSIIWLMKSSVVWEMNVNFMLTKI